MRTSPPSLARRLAAAVAVSVAACAACGPGLGSYTWYRELPKGEWATSTGQYVIGVGDTISVEVYEQEALKTRAKVRTDGRIALPFLGEVVAEGRPPAMLSQEIAARYKEFFVSPRVTVAVEESQPVVVSLLGEVKTVGSITLAPPGGLLQALAQAGGPSEFADRSAIFVLRRTPEFRRIRFTYEDLVQNKDGAATFPLRTGDVIVVE